MATPAATTAPLPSAATLPPRVRSERARLWSTFVRNRAAVVGLGLAILIAAAALAATGSLSPRDGIELPVIG
jgi:hypothetical protein